MRRGFKEQNAFGAADPISAETFSFLSAVKANRVFEPARQFALNLFLAVIADRKLHDGRRK